MTKMSGRVSSYCVALFLSLTCVSAVQRLNSISDLKKIDFGQSVPKHSLILLHWFANTVNMDNNNVIHLTFNPNTDYGSHHYGNYERLLDPLPPGYRYYTVGNLNHGTSVHLPDYVVSPQREYEGRNRDRIIIRVREQRIDQVYITQHHDTSENLGTPYDLDHTYQITPNLLRQIREFSVRDNQLPLVHLRNRYRSNADDFYIKCIWGNLACLGLLLFIVTEEKYSSDQSNNRPKINRPANNIIKETYNRPANNIRETYNRPANNIIRETNNRPANNIIRETNNRPANNIIRETNNRPANNIIRETNRRHCPRCGLVIGCLITLFILVSICVLVIYFVK